MNRLRHLLLVGVLAGLVAGAATTAVQLVAVVPLILAAEVLEHEHDADAAHTAAARSQPGLKRHAYTLLFNILAGVGFGLLLAAAYNLRGAVNWRSGLLWGLAGFATVYLAPSLGLPPNPPGADLAELGARQAWWLGTAAATGLGLALLVFARPGWVKALGIAAVLLPHLIGAPQSPARFTPPHELARSFVVWSALAALTFWLALGGVSGWLFERLVRRAQHE